MKKQILLALLLIVSCGMLRAQRSMEKLDRGLVALKSGNNVYLSWRILGEEWYDVDYNVYRNGTKLNATTLQTSNYLDTSGSTEATYQIASVVKGVEKEKSKAVSVLSKPYLEIPLQPIIKNGKDYSSLYEANDACAADLDGDGEYEIIIKRAEFDFSVANDSAFCIFQAYKMDGTLMWTIDCGPNLVSEGHVETNCVAFDFDEDGKAEVVMRAADGTVLPDGYVMGTKEGTALKSYRSSTSLKYMCEGAEYLVVMKGATGELMDYTNFIPRGNVSDWGDNYGHRANKFSLGAPYLDGRHPSIYTGRGCYTQIKMRTYDLVDGKLKSRWTYECMDSGSKFFGQGFHNFSIVDVDGDGCDEICQGNMVIDNDGKEKSSTGLGHGDAQHYGDFDPYRKGIEGFRCLESSPGAVLVDASTNEILMRWERGSDCGRAMAGNFTDQFPGAELVSAGSPGLWDATLSRIPSATVSTNFTGISQNFRIYWDGDDLEETFDYSSYTTNLGANGAVYKYGVGSIFTATDTYTNNGSKGNPCLQADLFGDWREEFILRSQDGKSIRIYTTTTPTEIRNYSLMFDPQYRQAIYWQMCGYNQPPHVSYFLGKAEGYMVPPPPSITNGRTEVDGSITSAQNDQHVILCNTAGGSVDVASGATPYLVTVNSPANYTLTGTPFSGGMRLVKQGAGALTFGGEQTYTGETNLWNGTMNFTGSLNSAVWMNRFTEMNATDATFKKGMKMEYGSILRPAGANVCGVCTLDSLYMRFGAIYEVDLNSTNLTSDQLKVNGTLRIDDYYNNLGCAPIFRFIAHNAEGATTPTAGKYLVAEANTIIGDVSHLTLEGLNGMNCQLETENGKIYLVVNDMRAPTQVTWKGQEGTTWDLAKAKNFLNGETALSFVTGDSVLFDDNASSLSVNLSSEVQPATVAVNSTKAYTFGGDGFMAGAAKFTKEGSGTLTINNVNSYTGGTTLAGGITKVKTLATSQLDGALGTLSTQAKNFVMTNGATLYTTEAVVMESPMTMTGDGGVLNCGSSFNMKAAVYGTTLTKKGSGQLNFTCANPLKKSIVMAGTLYMSTDMATPGDTIELQGGTLSDNDNSGTYSIRSYVIKVPEGKIGTINLDSRAEYTGMLLGGGTLKVNVPYIRTQMEGNWSGFTGIVQPTNTNNGLNFDNAYGLPNATLDIPSGVGVFNTGQVFKIGKLTGSGVLGGICYPASSGANTWNIGSKEDCTFEGKITSNSSVIKSGSGKVTFKGMSDYTGSTMINEGTLCLNNTAATSAMLGTGALNIATGGTLSGAGLLGNSLVTLNGTLQPGITATSLSGDIDFGGKSLAANSTSVMALYISSSKRYTGLSNIGTLTMKGATIKVTLRSGYTPAIGDSIVLWTANRYMQVTAPVLNLEAPAGYEWDTSGLSRGVLRIGGYTDLKLINANEVLKATVVSLEGTVVGEFETTYDEILQNLNKTSLKGGVYILQLKSQNGSASKKYLKS